MWVAWVAKLSLFATTTIASSGRNCIIYPNSWPHWFCRSTRSSDKKSSLAPTNIHLLFFLSQSLSLFDDNSGQGCASAAQPWFISSCATSSVRKLSTRMINVWVNFLTSYIGNWMHFCSIKSFWNLKDSHIDIAIDQRFEAFLVKVGRCWEAISHHMLCVCESHLAAFFM